MTAPVKLRRLSRSRFSSKGRAPGVGGGFDSCAASLLNPNICGALGVGIEHLQMRLGAAGCMSWRWLTSSIWTRLNSGLTHVIDAICERERGERTSHLADYSDYNGPLSGDSFAAVL